MTAANPERGEVEIELGGKAYPMRPSYRALKEIEATTGRPIMGLLLDGREGGFRVSDLAAVVTAGIQEAGRSRNDSMLKGVNVEKIGELIYEQGLYEAAGPVVEFLINACEGGAKPATGKKKAEPSGKA